MKNALNDLAILGGVPAFNTTLHVGYPNIGNREKLFQRINSILEQGWLTNNGRLVNEFEKRISEQVGVKHCIAVCNGTIALEIAVRALNMKGEVIVPSFTFVATAHCLQWQEITPVFCDINPHEYTIDPECIERLITPRTTGIIGVHLWGKPCNIERLTQIAKKNNLKLLFDASHAFGCTYKDAMVGSSGNAEVFSFHATKFINTFEGGAITTNDDSLAEKIRLMKNFGFSGMDNVIYLGTNGKMNEVSAAMGLTSLESMNDFIEVNRQNYSAYLDQLEGIPGITLRKYDEQKNNYQYIVIDIDENKTGVTRDQLMRIFHAENVRARRYFYPGCHRMEPYRSYYPNANLLLNETEKASERLLCLPTGTAINSDHIKIICQIIRLVVEHGKEFYQRLSTYHDDQKE